MEDVLCNIEIVKENALFIAHVYMEGGGKRDYKSKNIEEVLEQMAIELQEELDQA